MSFGLTADPVAGSEGKALYQTMATVKAVRNRALPIAEDNPHYIIFAVQVRQYPSTRLLVQSSVAPIELGREMSPYMETQALHGFVRAHQVELAQDAPQEMYIYNWVEKAQGPMVFDVGVPIADDAIVPEDDRFFVKTYPPIKVASIIYEGPFPYQEMSGWDHIQWEQRSYQAGHVYTHRVYRELYHAYDFDDNRHVTEIQIEIE
ncbi:MAG: GyrI-like domain-containing protein [Pseudomonadota bacterium]